jgi:hypothetical protein
MMFTKADPQQAVAYVNSMLKGKLMAGMWGAHTAPSIIVFYVQADWYPELSSLHGYVRECFTDALGPYTDRRGSRLTWDLGACRCIELDVTMHSKGIRIALHDIGEGV